MSSEVLADRQLRVLSQIDLSPCNGCDSCGLRCEAGVPMTRSEFDSVQRYITESPDRADIRRVEAQNKEVDLGDGVRVTMCRFRDMEGGGCAVYPARPLICRLMGHVEWMPCPIEKVTKRASTVDALRLMHAYSSLERHTYEEWQSGDCGGSNVP